LNDISHLETSVETFAVLFPVYLQIAFRDEWTTNASSSRSFTERRKEACASNERFYRLESRMLLLRSSSQPRRKLGRIASRGPVDTPVLLWRVRDHESTTETRGHGDEDVTESDRIADCKRA